MADSDIHKKLWDASAAGDGDGVRDLLAAGADPDKYKDRYGYTALLEAAAWGRDSIVSILIQHGADINRQGYYGNTALHSTAVNGHNEVTATLIKAGADMNIQCKDGETVLHWAAKRGNNKITTLYK